MAGVLLLALLAQTALAWTQDRADAGMPAIEGRVVAGDVTGTPLRGARVTVTAHGVDSNPVFTDDEGRLPSGSPSRHRSR